MSELERTILERLAHLETEVERLKSVNFADKAIEFERLPAWATVGKDYVAYRFHCSEEAVLRGRAGTHKVGRVSNKPLKFIKRDVNAAWREHTKTVAEKAAEEIAKAPTVNRRRSIITRK